MPASKRLPAVLPRRKTEVDRLLTEIEVLRKQVVIIEQRATAAEIREEALARTLAAWIDAYQKLR